MCVFLLVVIASAVGTPAGKSTVLGKGALLTTIGKGPVAIVLAAILVLMIGGLFRRIAFEYLVRLPGPILVRDLAVSSTSNAGVAVHPQPAGASDLAGIDVVQLSNTFRRRLQELRLQAPTPIPGAVAPQDYLDLLDAQHLNTNNPLGSLISALRAAAPTHGYEVSPSLVVERASSSECRYRITTQVTRLPHGALPVETVCAKSCDEAIVKAADLVTAVILPLTKLSNRPPWSGWRHYPMPSQLVHHFERSQQLSTERRYDEALRHCYAALELDPKSVDLRLHLGNVQEKLGLFVDAAATYFAARNIADETEQARELYNPLSRRKRKISGDVASYRFAILLAGEKASLQWLEAEEQNSRAEELNRVRQRLRPELQRLLDEHGLGHKDADKPDDHIDGRLKYENATHDSDEFVQLSDLLAQLAAEILRPISRRLRRPMSPRTWLSPLAVELTIKLVDLHRQFLATNGHDRESTGTKWPPRPEDLEAKVARAGLFRTWTERYNAACLLAFPLLAVNDSSPPAGEERPSSKTGEQDLSLAMDDDTRDMFAFLAVRQLEKAMARATSVHVASRRDWVLSEDPDLRGLRHTTHFKRFEARYFPSGSRTPARTENVHVWELAAYASMLISETAKRWARAWQLRKSASGDQITPLLAEEIPAWRWVREVTGEYRHWRTRLGLIDRMSEWSYRHGFDPFVVGIPKFEERFGAERAPDPSDEMADIERRVSQDIEGTRTKLSALHQLLVPDTLERPAQPSGSNGAKAPRLPAPIGEVHAALWQKLYDWMVAVTPADCDSCQRDFAALVGQTRNLTVTPEDTLRPIRGGARNTSRQQRLAAREAKVKPHRRSG